MSKLYSGPYIDVPYQVSIHLVDGFQRRRLKCEVNGRQTTDAKWWQKLTLPLARWAKKASYMYKMTTLVVQWLDSGFECQTGQPKIIILLLAASPLKTCDIKGKEQFVQYIISGCMRYTSLWTLIKHKNFLMICTNRPFVHDISNFDSKIMFYKSYFPLK